MMKHAWQLQDAKNKFSRVVENACRQGPQIVTRHGRETVVILSMDDFKKLKKPRNSLVEFLRKPQLVGTNLKLKRPRDLPRKVLP